MLFFTSSHHSEVCSDNYYESLLTNTIIEVSFTSANMDVTSTKIITETSSRGCLLSTCVSFVFDYEAIKSLITQKRIMYI